MVWLIVTLECIGISLSLGGCRPEPKVHVDYGLNQIPHVLSSRSLVQCISCTFRTALPFLFLWHILFSFYPIMYYSSVYPPYQFDFCIASNMTVMVLLRWSFIKWLNQNLNKIKLEDKTEKNVWRWEGNWTLDNCVWVGVCARLHMCVFYYDLTLEPEYYEKWFAERWREKNYRARKVSGM